MSNAVTLTSKDEKKELIEALADQWVNLVFAHIEFTQRSKKELTKQYKTKQKYEFHNNTKSDI